MISSLLLEMAIAHPKRTFLSWESGAISYGDASAQVAHRAAQWRTLSKRNVGISGETNPDFFLTLLALDRLGSRAYLIPSGLAATTTQAIAKRLGFVLFAGKVLEEMELSDKEADASRASGEVVIFSSGTTGAPKGALHTWETLVSRTHSSPAFEGARWLLTYQPAAFAGLQVFLHVLRNSGQLTFGYGEPARLVALAARDHVTHLSGTPTFFRLVLSTALESTFADLHPQQLTLGGEVVDEAILRSLKARFPQTRITHIYASTEAGVGFSVHDEKPGFPTSYLKKGSAIVEMKIVKGELFLKSASRMKRYVDEPTGPPSDFIATGDLVRISDDRVYFVGRKKERINVGGNKVSPSEVEQVLLNLPIVQSARVYATKSSLTGAIVSADVVLHKGCDPVTARAAILEACQKQLTAFKVPRLLQFVNELPIASSGKISRRA